MENKQKKAMQKKKEREIEKTEDKKREVVREREETRSGTIPRHVWFFSLGAVLVLLAILTWTLLF